MNLPTHPIRVLLRHSTLAGAATLRALGAVPVEMRAGFSNGHEHLFLELSQPAPVNSVLGLADQSDPEPWAFQVRRVVIGADGLRGCVGRRVDGSLLAETDLLDTEHLSPLSPDEVAQHFNNPNQKAAHGSDVMTFQPVGAAIPVTVIPTQAEEPEGKARKARNRA